MFFHVMFGQTEVCSKHTHTQGESQTETGKVVFCRFYMVMLFVR